MPTRNVVLTDYQSELVERLVGSGRYQNASEVLREGLRLLESRDVEEKVRLRALREAARVGIADIDVPRCSTRDKPGRFLDVIGNADHACEIVSAPAGDDAHRDAGVRELAADLPDEPVAAHHDHGLAALGRLARLLATVLDVLREDHSVVDPAVGKRCLRLRQELACAPTARGGIDEQEMRGLLGLGSHSLNLDH